MLKKFGLLLILLLLNTNIAYAANNNTNPKSVLQAFYTAYITENSKMPVNQSKISAIKDKYLTKPLLANIANLDYDPILNAQDCDINWLQSLSITKMPSLKRTYIVSYTDPYNKKSVNIKVIVTSQKPFKIQQIIAQKTSP